MWTPKLFSTTLESGRLIALVGYDNSDDATLSFTEKVDITTFTASVFKSIVKARVDSLSNPPSILPGSIDTTVVQTQADIDLQTFLADYRKWLQVKKAIDAGILTGLEIQVVALKNRVISEFKPAYIDFI